MVGILLLFSTNSAQTPLIQIQNESQSIITNLINSAISITQLTQQIAQTNLNNTTQQHQQHTTAHTTRVGEQRARGASFNANQKAASEPESPASGDPEGHSRVLLVARSKATLELANEAEKRARQAKEETETQAKEADKILEYAKDAHTLAQDMQKEFGQSREKLAKIIPDFIEKTHTLCNFIKAHPSYRERNLAEAVSSVVVVADTMHNFSSRKASNEKMKWFGLMALSGAVSIFFDIAERVCSDHNECSSTFNNSTNTTTKTCNLDACMKATGWISVSLEWIAVFIGGYTFYYSNLVKETRPTNFFKTGFFSEWWNKFFYCSAITFVAITVILDTVYTALALHTDVFKENKDAKDGMYGGVTFSNFIATTLNAAIFAHLLRGQPTFHPTNPN